jgi:hypothetical protein
MQQKQKNKRQKNGIITRVEKYPFLVLNGFDETGEVIWVDYGKYFKVYIKSEYYEHN